MRMLNPLWRIYIFIVVMSLVTASAIIYVEWQEVKSTARTDLKYANNIFTHSLQSLLHKNELFLDILGNRLIELDPYKQPAQTRRLVNELLKKSPELAGFGLANPDGQLIITSFNIDRSRLPNLLKSAKTAESFKKALASDKMVMGRTYYMKALKQWVIPIRYRIKNDKGDVVAVMATGLKFDTTKSIWSNESLPKDMETIIIRKDLYPQYVSNIKKSEYKEIYNQTVKKENFYFLEKPNLNKNRQEDNHVISTVSYNDSYGYYTFIFIPLTILLKELILPVTWLAALFIFFNIALYFVFRLSITSNAKSRRDMQAMFDHSPTIIYIRDTKGNFIFINRKFEEQHKLKRDEILGKNARDIFTADTANRMTFNDLLVIQDGRTFEYEEELQINDDKISYMSTKFPLYDNNKNIYAIAGISTDITQRKHQEELLRNSQKMEAMGKLTGGIAHDYNNMLSVILGYAELLKTFLQGQAELSSYADEIEHAAQRGAKLTKKLLSFTRSKNTDTEVIDINTLLLEEQNMLEKTLTARIKLNYDLEKDIWPIMIDAHDLEDAILNITINAMHAIKNNGELNIQTQNQHLHEYSAEQLGINAGDYVTLAFSDTGCGMDNETQEKIFDPFYSTKGTKGTGLGLSQVYGFVQRSGGKINVYSEINEGTIFKLYFPRQIDDVDQEITCHKVPEENLKGSETILLVDDEDALLKLNAEIISNEGYNILCASSGEEALNILKENSVHLMISDVVMPEMDGYKLATIVQKKYPATKIQLASGFASEYESVLVDNNLKENILGKPFSQQDLLKRIRNILDNKPF